MESHPRRRTLRSSTRTGKPTLTSHHTRPRRRQPDPNPRRCPKRHHSHMSTRTTASHSNSTNQDHSDSTEQNHTTPPPARAVPPHPRDRAINRGLRRTGPPQHPRPSSPKCVVPCLHPNGHHSQRTCPTVASVPDFYRQFADTIHAQHGQVGDSRRGSKLMCRRRTWVPLASRGAKPVEQAQRNAGGHDPGRLTPDGTDRLSDLLGCQPCPRQPHRPPGRSSPSRWSRSS